MNSGGQVDKKAAGKKKRHYLSLFPPSALFLCSAKTDTCYIKLTYMVRALPLKWPSEGM